MNLHFEKIIRRIIFLLLSLFLFSSCQLMPINKIEPSVTGPPIDQTIYTSRIDEYVCPDRLAKLCEAYGTIQIKYIRHFSDDELTQMFVRGATEKIRETDPLFLPDIKIQSAGFICSPHAQKICDAYASVKNQYKKPVSDKHLIEVFINGFISVINETDPYTKYASTVEKNVDYFQYPGVGIIAKKEKIFPFGLIIRTVKEYNPAWFAGLRRGDRITHVDGISLVNKTEKEANALIRGKAGESVRLTVVSGCEHKMKNVVIVRRDVRDIMSDKVKVLDEHYGYVRLAEFNVATAVIFKSSVEQFEKEHGKMRGLILDLRNDPGGQVMEAVKLVSLFVEKSGSVLFEQGQKGKLVSWNILQNSKDILQGKTLVVLVNEDTASASEITSGALQEYKRAVIVGMKTYGKGCLQTNFHLKDGSILDLTAAHTITPVKHKNIDKGIQPDVIIKEGADESCTGDQQLAVALKILHQKEGL